MKKLFTLLFSLSLVIFANAADKYAQGAIDWAVGPWYDAATGGAATTAPAAGDNVFTQGNIITIAADAVCDNLTFTSLAGQFVISPAVTLTVRGKVDCTAAGTLDAFSTMDVTAILKLTGEALAAADYILVTNNGAVGMRPKNLVIQAANTANTYKFGTSNVNYVHGTGYFKIMGGTKIDLETIMQLGSATDNNFIIEEGATVVTKQNVKAVATNNTKVTTVTINGMLTCNAGLNATTIAIGNNGYFKTLRGKATNDDVAYTGWWAATGTPLTTSTNYGIPTTITIGTNGVVEFAGGASQYLPGVIPGTTTTIPYVNVVVSGTATKNVQTALTATGAVLNFGTLAGATVTCSNIINVSSADILKGTVSGTIVASNVSLVATPLAGYRFVNWTKDGNEESTSATYIFPVAGKTVIANFDASTAVKNTTVINAFAVVNGNNIQLNGDINSIEIYNAQGKLIKSQSKVTTISVDSKGIYLVKMNAASGSKVQKVIVN